MSAVFWANILNGEELIGHQEDLRQLFAQSVRLDKVMKELSIMLISEMVDTTDHQVNMGQLALPEGVEASDTLMVQSGVWVPIAIARDSLETLAAHLEREKPRLGLLRDHRPGVQAELIAVLHFISEHGAAGARFNFAHVM